MATIKYEDVHPDDSSCSQDIGEGPPGPSVLPYVDENNPEKGVLWLNADEWATVRRQQTPSTSEETPQQPSNEGTNSQLPVTKQASPQVSGLVTRKPRSPEEESDFRQQIKPLLKTTRFYRYRASRGVPQKMTDWTLTQPYRWRSIKWVMFEEIHCQHNVRHWDHNTIVDMKHYSQLLWESDHCPLPAKGKMKPVTVAVFKHANNGLWCEVASTVSSHKLCILEPKFM